MGRRDQRVEPEETSEEKLFAMAFGRALQVARAERGISRAELADRAELSRSYLTEIENGSKAPSARVQQALAKGLGLSVSDLVRLAESYQAQIAEGLFDEEELAVPTAARAPVERSLGRTRLGLSADAPPPPAALRELGYESSAGEPPASWITASLERDLRRLRERLDKLDGSVSEVRAAEAAAGAQRVELENRITRWQDRLTDIVQRVTRIEERQEALTRLLARLDPDERGRP